MTSENLPTSPPGGLARQALVYGGVAGLAFAAWMILESALGFHTTRPEIGRFTSYAALAIPIAAIILGVMRWRDRTPENPMGFARAMGSALAIGMVFAVVVGAAAWVHAALIDPGLIGDRIDASAATMRRNGMDADRIAEWQRTMHANATPALYTFQLFAGTLVQCFIISLMAALVIVVRKRPGSSVRRP